MSSIPADLKYTKSHEWLKLAADGTAVIGITEHAQDQLGDMVYVEVPDAGRNVGAGDACAVVESVKAASDVYAPVAGEVIEGNAALADTPYVEESARVNREGMRQLEAGLAKLGVAFVPSHGNFLLVNVGDGARVYAALLRDGVIVRPVGNYGLPGFLRVTVGLPAENERFLAALARAIGR